MACALARRHALSQIELQVQRHEVVAQAVPESMAVAADLVRAIVAIE
jgi:hypothetical protein